MTDHVLDEAQGVRLGRLVEQTDWDASPLGHPDSWPEGLRTLFATCLECRFAFCMWWGPELGFLYNDAYAPMLGAKHPAALGRLGAEVWTEIWDVVGPMLRGVMRSGEATHSDDLLLVMRRHGYIEEAYFTFSYSPIRDASDAIVGIFTPVVETTARVVGERRLRTLRDLAARCLDAASAEEACRLAAAVLAENPHDVPFALLYRIGEDGDQASLAGSAGVEAGHAMAPRTLALDDPAAWTLTRTHQPRIVENLGQRFVDIPTGAWPDPPARALILPVGLHGKGGPAAILIVGINPRRELDEEHRGFHTLLGGQITTVLARVSAYEEERRRAEKLAEIDRAKTAFFSNISHEFRTPLTLILGPIEEALSRAAPEDRALLEGAHRNGLRLLRLVNALLDFSRVEAGRAQASYGPEDLAALTADLAGNFRAACERAGVALDVDCPPMARPVFVDRDMWEMIVLNLVSNAFKFTIEGRIAVGLRDAGDAAELTVRDTGIGIAAAELPRLFERFHRVEAARGRTMEGSGIGLALVQELVRLHGGTIGVESTPDRGSAFTVRVPFGIAHLDADRIGAARPAASSAASAHAFVEEALRWLPGADPKGTGSTAVPSRPRILLADDNADMRDYVHRLLGAQYDVEAVTDGQAALEAAARDPPDLVLTDVMMPRLDGIGLLRALRIAPATRGLPIILLSARAGEEARIEGLDAGADDYLAKPFAARELLARVRANLDLANARREAGVTSAAWRDRYEAAARASGDLLFDWNAETGELLFGSELERVTGYTHADLAGGIPAWLAIVHPEDRTRVSRELVRLRTTDGAGFAAYRIRRKDGRVVDLEARGHFVRDPSDGGRRMVGFARDVTDRNRSEAHQAMLIDELNHRVKNTLAAVQSIARQTLRGPGSAVDLGEQFIGRLMSLSQTHGLLTDSHWRGTGLRDLVLAELSPYRDGDAAPRVTLRGQPVYLDPKTALALGMALHELATNGAKHGALSCDSGRVEVAWETARGHDGVPRLRLLWVETGGPPVVPPARRGFGSRLLERGLAMELNGDTRLDFDPAGLRCTIEFPMRGTEASR